MSKNALATLATVAPSTIIEIGDPLTYGATPVETDYVAPKVNFDDPRTASLIVRILVTANPKKLGTTSRFRFDIYRDGMTLQQYVSDPRYPRKTLRADIHWDTSADHRFIKLTNPDGSDYTGFASR